MLVAHHVSRGVHMREFVAVADHGAVVEFHERLRGDVDRVQHRVVVAFDDPEGRAGVGDAGHEVIDGVPDTVGNRAVDVQQVASEHDQLWGELREQRVQALPEVVALAEREGDVGGGVSTDVEVREHEGVRAREVDGPLAERRPRRNVAHAHTWGLRGVSCGGHRCGFGTAVRRAGMVDVLADKRTATRFRILVEIADRQPAVSQGEIADAVGVTSQAVSEYIRELVEDDLVTKEGARGTASRRRAWTGCSAPRRTSAGTPTGSPRTCSARSRRTPPSPPRPSTPATRSLSRCGTASSTPRRAGGAATGVATTDAAADEEVGVTGFEGIIDLDPGEVTVYQVPSVRSGGSDVVDTERLRAAVADADIVLAAGVEVVVALRRVDTEPGVTFAAGEVAAEAASRGQRVVVVAVADQLGRVTDPLRDAPANYRVADLT